MIELTQDQKKIADAAYHRDYGDGITPQFRIHAACAAVLAASQTPDYDALYRAIVHQGNRAGLFKKFALEVIKELASAPYEPSGMVSLDAVEDIVGTVLIPDGARELLIKRLRTRFSQPVSECRVAQPDPEAAHDYTSTACQHGQHERCRKNCKFCQVPCRCPHHKQPASEKPASARTYEDGCRDAAEVAEEHNCLNAAASIRELANMTPLASEKPVHQVVVVHPTTEEYRERRRDLLFELQFIDTALPFLKDEKPGCFPPTVPEKPDSPPESEDERLELQTIQERDDMGDRLTVLAESVGHYFGVSVGEWSNCNEPDKIALGVLNGEYKTKFDKSPAAPEEPAKKTSFMGLANDGGCGNDNGPQEDDDRGNPHPSGPRHGCPYDYNDPETNRILERERAGPGGTFACPICGVEGIHQHTSEEIVTFRIASAAPDKPAPASLIDYERFGEGDNGNNRHPAPPAAPEPDPEWIVNPNTEVGFVARHFMHPWVNGHGDTPDAAIKMAKENMESITCQICGAIDRETGYPQTVKPNAAPSFPLESELDSLPIFQRALHSAFFDWQKRRYMNSWASLAAEAECRLLPDITDDQWADFCKDISDRRGLKSEWSKIDDDVKAEMRKKWSDIFFASRRTSPAPEGREQVTFERQGHLNLWGVLLDGRDQGVQFLEEKDRDRYAAGLRAEIAAKEGNK